jgi:hypothetical protein
MAISNVSSSMSTWDIQSLTSPTSSQTPAATDASSASGGVTVDISKPGQLMSELTSLAQSDPAQFKTVTADIASQLKDAASQSSGPQADFLNKLADKFSSASQSGSASDLAPSAGKAHGHHGGGHHRAHGGAGGAGQAGLAGLDQADSVEQQVQGIISTALSSLSSTAPAST